MSHGISVENWDDIRGWPVGDYSSIQLVKAFPMSIDPGGVSPRQLFLDISREYIGEAENTDLLAADFLREVPDVWHGNSSCFWYPVSFPKQHAVNNLLSGKIDGVGFFYKHSTLLGPEVFEKNSLRCVVSVRVSECESSVGHFLTDAHRLSYSGNETVPGSIWQNLFGIPTHDCSYVLSFLRLDTRACSNDNQVTVLAEALCAGVPGVAVPDNPLGSRGTSGLPRGLTRMADRWIYYGQQRRFGCVVLANNQSEYQVRSFPQEVNQKFFAILGLGILQSGQLSACKSQLSERRAESVTLGVDRPQHGFNQWAEELGLLRSWSEAILRLKVQFGAGVVSGRHGIQLFYDVVEAGLNLNSQRREIAETLSNFVEIAQAEAQLAEARTAAENGRLEKMLAQGAVFFAGFFGFLSIKDVVDKIPSWSQAFVSHGPQLLIPAVIWGVVSVSLLQLLRADWSKYKKSTFSRASRG